MSFSKKKDKKGGTAKDGKRRDDDDEFYMGASGQVVLGHARSFYNRKSGRTPQKQKQPKPPARTASGARKEGGSSGSPSPDGSKSLRDSLSDWLADVLPDGSRKSSDRKSGSPSERSKPKQPQLTASTAGWKSAGFVTTQNGGQKAGAASSSDGPSEGRGEISIGLDDSDRSLWSERSARSRRGSQDAPAGTS